MNRSLTLMIWMAALAILAPCVSRAERIEALNLSIGPGSTITFKMLVDSVFSRTCERIRNRNAGQGYLITTLFHVHQGRLKRIGEVLTMKGLGPCEASFDEKLSWRTEPDDRSPYRKVLCTVKLTMGLGEDEGGDCPRNKQAFRRKEFTQAYRWNSVHAVYQSEGKGFDALKRFNEKQF